MFKKLKTCILVLVVITAGTLFGACDPGIHDLKDFSNGEELLYDLEIQDFLNAKKSYGRLLKDLEFMNEWCYFDEPLAGAQAFTIMLSYGLADQAVEVSQLTQEQLNTKASLYACIKRINFYSNNFGEDIVNFYDSVEVYFNTQNAIYYCNIMLGYF